ncbi:hypothetical protein JKP88DRAFT_321224 [Tribonema minus]|uniref:ATP-dependent RNA helicase n=1 Tax=Tribonema minus TaxID=303371 RepID=A0A836CDB6_9STRA|nr:hypothetical protein JKP88DRAFT_321224 [Tribonema minus]
MGRKRQRDADWDDLAWKTVDVQLEQDDGWQAGGGGDGGEGCLFGALEEIDGAAYTMEADEKGVRKLVVKQPKQQQEAAPADDGEPLESAQAEAAAAPAKKKPKRKDKKAAAAAAEHDAADEHHHVQHDEQQGGEAEQQRSAGEQLDKNAKAKARRKAKKAAATAERKARKAAKAAAAAASAAAAAAASAAASDADVSADAAAESLGAGSEPPAANGKPGQPPKGAGKNFKKNQRKKLKFEARQAAQQAVGSDVPAGADADVAVPAAGPAESAEERIEPPAKKVKAHKPAAPAAAAAPASPAAAAAEAAQASADAAAAAASPAHAAPAAAAASAAALSNEELSDGELRALAQWVALGAPLPPALARGLLRLGFTAPTAIQRATLAKAISGRRDIVGAAQTGSGKTLAYGLPVLTGVLRAREKAAAQAAAAAEGGVGGGGDGSSGTGDGGSGSGGGSRGGLLQALVLCPTRELALQVTKHLVAVSEGTGVTKHLIAVSEGTGVGIVCIVGGLAEVKQSRLLKRRPEVVVATPGRLWEMRASEPHLRDLSGLRFLVIDEADRMAEKGRFEELGKLLRTINPPPEPETAPAAAKNRKKRGRNEAPMMDEAWMAKEQWLDPAAQGGEQGEGEGEGEGDGDEGGDEAALSNSDAQHHNKPPPPLQKPQKKQKQQQRSRQTLIFSATLAMGGADSRAGRGKKRGSSGGGGGAAAAGSSAQGLEANLQRIMELVGMSDKPAIVDISQVAPPAPVPAAEAAAAGDKEGEGEGEGGAEGGAGEGDSGAAPLPALPEGLTLAQTKSLQADKDAWLYLFATQFPGRTLVFVNAVVMARRVAQVLQLLRIPCAPLHAQMAQRARLRALDFLRTSERCCVIATDVAARGLDVPHVDHVVHYDAPRSAADFVHRSGRTARAGRGGFALSIIAPRDEAAFARVFAAVGYPAGLPALPCDPRLLDKARERALLAARARERALLAARVREEALLVARARCLGEAVTRCEAAQGKAGAARTLLSSLAGDADMVVDEAALAIADAEGGGARGGAHAARLAAEAARALAAALAEPLFSDRRKFLPVAEKLAEAAAEARRTAAGEVAAAAGGAAPRVRVRASSGVRKRKQ